jgi:hypothetical protein
MDIAPSQSSTRRMDRVEEMVTVVIPAIVLTDERLITAITDMDERLVVVIAGTEEESATDERLATVTGTILFVLKLHAIKADMERVRDMVEGARAKGRQEIVKAIAKAEEEEMAKAEEKAKPHRVH